MQKTNFSLFHSKYREKTINMTISLFLWWLFSMHVITIVETRTDYSMYVWPYGFDSAEEGCNTQAFLEWSNKSCFPHTWETEHQRQWLWNTCNVKGREIAAVFLSDVDKRLRDAYKSDNCRLNSVQVLRKTLKEGHSNVPGLKIYGLFAVSDIDVSEKGLVKFIVHYNDNCIKVEEERLDGVAVNNDAYGGIKCSNLTQRLTFLDNLKSITIEAAKQQTGTLLTHYSTGWHWGRCNGQQDLISWNGTDADANHHMIDIFDSVDVQVGYTTIEQISSRMHIGGYNYARALGKKIYVTLYTNKGDPCQTTFFPSNCSLGNHTEAGLIEIIDSFIDNNLSYASPCIHYFRGAYSSGGHPDWPSHLHQTHYVQSDGGVQAGDDVDATATCIMSDQSGSREATERSRSLLAISIFVWILNT